MRPLSPAGEEGEEGVRVRCILPTERPDYLPIVLWARTYRGALEGFERAMARLWIASILRPVRRLAKKGKGKQ